MAGVDRLEDLLTWQRVHELNIECSGDVAAAPGAGLPVSRSASRAGRYTRRKRWRRWSSATSPNQSSPGWTRSPPAACSRSPASSATSGHRKPAATRS